MGQEKGNKPVREITGLDWFDGKTPTEREKVYSDAYWSLFCGHLREYAEAKEKEQGQFSKWLEHQKGEDESSYWNIIGNNESIESERINNICNELDLIIKQLEKNPSERLIIRKVKRLETKFQGFKGALVDSIKYLLTNLESEYLCNLGETDAWIYLDEYLESLEEKEESIKRKSKVLCTPKWIKGSLDRLITQMKVEKFVSNEYDDEEIKNCFSGKPINEVRPIVFTKGIEESTKVQLMHHIDMANLIDKRTQEEKAYIIGVKKDDYKNTLYRQKIVTKISHIEEVRRIVRSVTLLIPN